MAEFLMGCAAFIMAMVAIGMARIVRGPAKADRMMAAQLVGTGSIAALMLGSAGRGGTAALDVALVLALLSVFASVSFALNAARKARSRAGSK